MYLVTTMIIVLRSVQGGHWAALKGTSGTLLGEISQKQAGKIAAMLVPVMVRLQRSAVSVQTAGHQNVDG